MAHQSLIERFGHLTSSQLYFLTAALLAVLAITGLAWFLGKMLAQQGRILIRLDALEGRLNQIPALSRSGGAAANGTPALQGLTIGAPAPAFRLADLTGKETGLAELLAAGLPVVLVFMDSHCGPCNALASDLGRWSREHAGRMTIAVVSRGRRRTTGPSMETQAWSTCCCRRRTKSPTGIWPVEHPALCCSGPMVVSAASSCKAPR